MTKWKGWKAITRDLIILWLVTFMGCTTVEILFAGSNLPIISTGLYSLFFGIAGFCISGCMVKKERWKHLFILAILFWLTSIINIFISDAILIDWVLSIFFTLITMGIGGRLSYIFKKPSDDKATSS